MNRKYTFDFPDIDICKEGYEPVPDSRFKSFLWDKNIRGITVKQKVYSQGDIDEEKTVKMRLAIIKDDDCRAFNNAAGRSFEWEHSKGDVSSSIQIDTATYQKLSDLYVKDLENASKEILEKIVCKLDFDYTMPVGKIEDSLTLDIPVQSDMFEANTLYRIGIYEYDKLPSSSYDWAVFAFFDLTGPVEKIFVPYSAYLKVMKPIGGMLYFDKSVNYRHYKDFYGDIHYGSVCQEVEVNPALLCFEFEAKCDKIDLMPFFKIVLTDKSTVIHSEICRLCDVEGTNRIIAFCQLSNENKRWSGYGEITASLQVFDRTIASYRFLTTKTEKGEMRF